MGLDTVEVFGFIESIVFSEPERGFTVARLKEPRRQELTCLVGYMPDVQPGETIRCKGVWKRHPQHGQQFEVASFALEAPADLVGIQKYLESGLIKGIGPKYAERIVYKFGLDTLKVIDEEPERLSEVPGLGKKRIDTLKACWQEQRSVREVMVFLRGHGVSPAYAQKIFKAYGDKSIDKVQENPYALAKEIFGIGFKIADGIAKGLGISQDAPMRLDAGIEHVLWELSNSGHVCYPRIELIEEAQTILEVAGPLIEERLAHLVRESLVMEEEGVVWVRPLYFAEVGIARELARIVHTSSLLRKVDVIRALAWVQTELKITLAKEQSEAVGCGIEDKALIITGGPGTGKSTITKAILRITEKLTDKIVLAAPTGRAAKRMSEITGKKASTIHSLLEMDFKTGGFKKNKENPLECDLIIVDEASMIDTLLMHHLLKAIPSHARVLLIGDIDQLPSVGPGNVLRDMIGSSCLPVCQLVQIFRQAAGSRIVTNAHRINQGEYPDISSVSKSDFHFIHEEEPEKIAQVILDLVKTRLPKAYRFHRFKEIQVLSPMRRGVVGSENLNVLLQQALNPSPSPLIRMGKSFHVGDKVMQIRNNYQKEVFNGDVGSIVEVDIEEETLAVLFDDRRVFYTFVELDEIVLAYAVSIHKYQGSECPCIIIPMHTSHFKLLTRNLLYTGITRGKKCVVLVGSKKAIGMAVSNKEVQKRHTGLQKRLQQVLPAAANFATSSAIDSSSTRLNNTSVAEKR